MAEIEGHFHFGTRCEDGARNGYAGPAKIPTPPASERTADTLPLDECTRDFSPIHCRSGLRAYKSRYGTEEQMCYELERRLIGFASERRLSGLLQRRR
jgi:hypothetical protein